MLFGLECQRPYTYYLCKVLVVLLGITTLLEESENVPQTPSLARKIDLMPEFAMMPTLHVHVHVQFFLYILLGL